MLRSIVIRLAGIDAASHVIHTNKAASRGGEPWKRG